MSASRNSQAIEFVLECRSQYVRPGLRKFAKTASSRAQRRAAKVELVASPELYSEGASVNFSVPYVRPGVRENSVDNFAEIDLEAWADDFLAAAQPEEDELPGLTEAELAGAEAEMEELEAIRRMPLHLLGSLPDWILEQLEQAEGDAFAHLSLFEKKSNTTPAAISMVDERMDA